jgi:hypothetical protein
VLRLGLHHRYISKGFILTKSLGVRSAWEASYLVRVVNGLHLGVLVLPLFQQRAMVSHLAGGCALVIWTARLCFSIGEGLHVGVLVLSLF